MELVGPYWSDVALLEWAWPWRSRCGVVRVVVALLEQYDLLGLGVTFLE